jgi:septal ring factor EnvC (AmiA/AmiB activator)
MTIEVALLLSFLSIFFAIFFGAISMRRNQKADDKREQSDMTTVIVKLESISSDTNEIKNDIKSLKSDVRHNSESIVRLDESLKSAWRRINEIASDKGE